jgi:hypothetical protein
MHKVSACCAFEATVVTASESDMPLLMVSASCLLEVRTVTASESDGQQNAETLIIAPMIASESDGLLSTDCASLGVSSGPNAATLRATLPLSDATLLQAALAADAELPHRSTSGNCADTLVSVTMPGNWTSAMGRLVAEVMQDAAWLPQGLPSMMPEAGIMHTALLGGP